MISPGICFCFWTPLGDYMSARLLCTFNMKIKLYLQ